MEQSQYEIIRINEDTWRIEDTGVRFFLLTGSERALLIDSGMQVQNAKEIAESITGLPVELLNTHADRDHIGSNGEFATFYMHPAEASNYYNTQNRAGAFTPVYDGDELDLGGRRLEIISLPGHTPGSIAVLDKKHRCLFSGDPIQDGIIFMFGLQREMHAYIHSLQRLKTRSEEFDEIFPSHSSIPVKPGQIDALIAGAKQVLAGEVTGRKVEVHGKAVLRYDIGAAAFLCDLKAEEK